MKERTTETFNEDTYYEHNGAIYRSRYKVYEVDQCDIDDAVEACNQCFEEYQDHSFNWNDVILKMEEI